MPENVCVCRSCVDPREHGFFAQHGLPYINNGFYMARNKGAFVPKPSPTHDISTTGLMLAQMNKTPTFILQGHRDCAAVRTLFQSYGKKPDALNETEREFRRSYSATLEIVKKMASDLPDQEQLRILEKLCVLQGINNLFDYAELMERKNNQSTAHAYYSLTSPPSEGPAPEPEKIGLMIYDPRQKSFASASAPQCKNGIRMVDLIDSRAFTPHDHDRFKITASIDLRAVAQNEVRACAL